MSNFPNVTVERKNILDLLILVAAITGLINFITNFVSWWINRETIQSQQLLNISSDKWLWFWLIFLLIVIIIWRVSKSSLFSFKINKRLPLIFIYDKKNKNLLKMNDYDTPYYHAWCAFNELLQVDEKFREILPSVDDKGIGNSNFGDKLRDIFEYAILATISKPFFGDWKIEDEQISFGCKISTPSKGGIEIKYDNLPIKLRSENIILKTFEERFRNTSEIRGLNWVTLSLPPKTKLTYEGKKLFYSNRYIKFSIDFSMKFQRAGTPVNLLNDNLAEQDRFITLTLDPLISVKMTRYLMLTSASESNADWSMDFIRRIENHLITNEKDYAEKIKKDNPDIVNLGEN